jgi:hypothetical protein
VREAYAKLLAVSPATDKPNDWGKRPFLRIEEPTSYTGPNGQKRWHYDGLDIIWRADGPAEFCDGDGFTGEFADKSELPRWKPSIHMPREFSRTTLENKVVRIERLQEITEADAKAEGAVPADCCYSHYHGFQKLWDSMYSKPMPVKGKGGVRHYVSYPWEDIQETRTHRGKPWYVWGNPWVWVIAYARILASEDSQITAKKEITHANNYR